MIKSIIVDDEQFTLDEIRDTIKGFNELEVIEATTNPNKALEMIKKHDIQLAFLDIEMQGISGISLAEKMIEIKPNIEVVFITAYDNYAYDAFEANAIDYVLKPIRVERLEKTIKKVLKIIKTQKEIKKDELKVRFFKKFRVFNEEESVRWRTSKDGELLAYLIENVGIPIHKEKLIDKIWADVDLKNALIYLQSSIYRIRKLFSKYGYEDTIKYANNSYIIKDIDIDCDLWRFNKYLNKKYILSDANISEYEKIFELYVGDYLEEDAYVWAMDMQENLKHKYLKLVTSIGAYYMRKNDFNKAIEYLEKLVKVDPFYDEGIKLLFKCHYEKNEIRDLRKQFTKLESIAQEEYGVYLTEDIVRYYNTLIKK